MNTMKKTTVAGLAAIALVAMGATAMPTSAHADGKLIGAAIVGGFVGSMLTHAHHANTYHNPTYVMQQPVYPTCQLATQTYWANGVRYTRQVQVCH